MTTINEHIQSLTAEFAKLSASRQSALKRQAIAHIAAKPASADNNGFWRGLSARQVIAAASR